MNNSEIKRKAEEWLDQNMDSYRHHRFFHNNTVPRRETPTINPDQYRKDAGYLVKDMFDSILSTDNLTLSKLGQCGYTATGEYIKIEEDTPGPIYLYDPTKPLPEPVNVNDRDFYRWYKTKEGELYIHISEVNELMKEKSDIS